MQQNVVEILKNMVDTRPIVAKQKIETNRKIVTQLEEKERNLVNAIELGRGLDQLIERLGTITNEKENLLRRIQDLREVNNANIDLAHIAREVAEYTLNFEREFEEGSIEVKKALMKQIISEIIVDRDQKVVGFYINRLPGNKSRAVRLVPQ
jgi:hypothetical protein